MIAKYELTNKAVEDLNEIWDYTLTHWSEKQADKYYQLLIDSCQAIADNPKLGRSYKEIDPELFGLKVHRHIIFYRKLMDKPMEITRILHERMNLKDRIVH